MSDLAATSQEFAKFVEVVLSKGRKPNDDDIDFFLDNYLDNRRRGFLYEGVYIRNAYYVDPATGQQNFDVSGKSFSDMVANLKPVLKQKVIDAYGSISEEYAPYEWMTAPMTVDEYAVYFAAQMGKTDQFQKLSGRDRMNHPAYQKAVKELLRVKYRIKEYMRTVMPFIGRMTMHHNLAAVRYDTQKGPFNELVRNSKERSPFVIHGEEELQQWVQAKDLSGFPGVEHDALRSIFWEPTETGVNLKMGVIDIDNPANLPHAELMKYTKKIYRRMAFDLNHPTIIMFTGASYQIWIGQNGDVYLGDTRQMIDYLKSVLSDILPTKREDAIEEGKPYVDLTTNKKRGLVRSFFSLHYPPNGKSDKPYSGLAAVPVAFTDVDTFTPSRDAHPETVLANFDAYSSFVASFYDKVQIGQDYESEGETEMQPSCSRLEERHPDANVLKAIYKTKDLIQVEYRNIGAALEDETKVYAHPVARGVLGVLVYDPKGSTLLPGMVTQRTSARNRVVLDKPKSYYILENGTVFYDDYICRDFERVCEARKIRQAVLVGRISKIDSFGNEETVDETRNALIRTEGVLPQDARVMRFTINRASMVNGSAVPIAMMGEQIKEFSAKRIVPAAYYEFESPVGMKVKTLFNDLLRSRMMGSMMIEGEEKYLVKSTRTIMATVMAMDTTGRAYDSTKTPPVIIGLAKPSNKYGVEYMMIGKAQIALKKEDDITLRTLIEGPDKRRVIPPPRGSGAEGKIVFTEPSVVVEVAYDDITPQRMANATFVFTSDGRYRPVKPVYASNRIINARIISIQEDLDYRKPSNISIKQDPLIELSRKTTKEDSLLDGLPNPNDGYPRFIKRNPAFFGVTESLTTKLGIPTEKGLVGGRTVQIPLIRPGPFYLGQRLPGELEAPYKRYIRGEDGYKVFVDSNSLVKTQTPPNYRVTNLGWEYTDAIDDTFGMGQDGNAVTRMDDQLSPIKSYSDVMEIYHLKGNRLQAIEDAKVLGYTTRRIPGNRGSEDGNRRGYDKDYIEAYAGETTKLHKSLGTTSLRKSAEDELYEAILSNPAVKDDVWQRRVDTYVEEFNKWDALPEPKEEWELYAVGMFSTWEVPMLEKERLMRIATQQYTLTDEETARIDLEYSEEITGELFDLILSDLYEVPEDDEEAELEAP